MRYNQITLLHVVGCIMILLCHFYQDAQIRSLGEIFLSGLSLFFIISGFLAGQKVNFDIDWLKKRFLRIFIPYYLTIIPILIICYFFEPSQFRWDTSAYMLTCTQGLNYIIWKFDAFEATIGIGHLWFITVILFCALMTPLISKVTKCSILSNKTWIFIVASILLFLQPISVLLGFQLSYIISYFLGFVIAKKQKDFTAHSVLIMFLLFAVISVIRFLGMKYMDGSVIYDRYIALISQASLAFLIFYIMFYVNTKFPKSVSYLANTKVVIFLSTIIFEIFLTHYFFLKGPWAISNYIDNLFIADIIVVILSVIASIIISRISNLFFVRK